MIYLRMNKRKKILSLLTVFLLLNPLTLKILLTHLETIINDENLIYISRGYEEIEASGNLVTDEEASRLNKANITGENYSFDPLYYPYYGLLNEDEKKLYKQIYAHANEVIEEFVPIVDVSVASVKKTLEAVYNDHPELFWVDTSYSYKYLSTNNCVQINLKFNETAKDLNKYKVIFNKHADAIISKASKLNSDYEKEKYVHDQLIKTVVYDKSSSLNQSAYSALVYKKTICAGYARAFQYIMIRLKIPTYYCVGVSSVDHAWNIVKLSDGYYNVDLTWDDNDNNQYQYFNCTDSKFSVTHKRTGLSSYLPRCMATRYSLKITNEPTKNFTMNNSNYNNIMSGNKDEDSKNAISNEINDNELLSGEEQLSNRLDNSLNNEIDNDNGGVKIDEQSADNQSE